MEVGQLVLEGAIAAVSGVTGAGAILWKLSGKLTDLGNHVKGLKESLEKLEKSVDTKVTELKQNIEKLDQEMTDDRRAGEQQWQEIRYTLGTIEGAMTGSVTGLKPPPRRPGGV